MRRCESARCEGATVSRRRSPRRTPDEPPLAPSHSRTFALPSHGYPRPQLRRHRPQRPLDSNRCDGEQPRQRRDDRVQEEPGELRGPDVPAAQAAGDAQRRRRRDAGGAAGGPRREGEQHAGELRAGAAGDDEPAVRHRHRGRRVLQGPRARRHRRRRGVHAGGQLLPQRRGRDGPRLGRRLPPRPADHDTRRRDGRVDQHRRAGDGHAQPARSRRRRWGGSSCRGSSTRRG